MFIENFILFIYFSSDFLTCEFKARCESCRILSTWRGRLGSEIDLTVQNLGEFLKLCTRFRGLFCEKTNIALKASRY